MCKRTWRLVFAAAIFPTLSYAAGFGDPLPGLTPEQQTKFQDGKAAFVTAEAASAGLGPIFNENSCAVCHVGPAGTVATGAIGGTTERLETRFGKSVYGTFDPLTQKGGSLLQDHAIGAAAQFLVNPTPYCLTFVFARSGGCGPRQHLGRAGRIRGYLLSRHFRPAEPPHQCGQRRASDRPLRLEGAGAHAPRFQRRRLPQRDGRDQPFVHGRELSAGGLLHCRRPPALLQSFSRPER